MHVSVVVCTHSLDRYDDFREAVDSLRNQTHEPVQIVVVVDGNEALADRVAADYGDAGDVTIRRNGENLGLSRSRNRGVEAADGDVVAFVDDDAVATETWVERLVAVYERTDAVAVGGKMVGEWIDGEPVTLPAEFYWLVGVTYPGFAERGEEVRNTFGSNISFRRSVFETLDGFDPAVGRRGEQHLQAEEAEFCARMVREFGRGVVYEPDAVVRHKVYPERTRIGWLLRRAFWQGYSKRAMADLVPDAGGTESAYLRRLLGEFVPGRLRGLLAGPSVSKLMQLFALFALTAATGAGYGYAVLAWRGSE